MKDYKELLKKYKIEEKSKASIKTKDSTYEGIIMPSQKQEILTLKLNNGYNIGIKISKVEGIKNLGKVEPKEKKIIQNVKNSNLPNITILHCGGTIASKVDYETGGVVPLFDANDLLEMVPELNSIANIKTQTVFNIFSEDMTLSHYSILAKAIENEIKNGAYGIIITHGTDTMHYSASAMAFALEGLPIPVILVGAQRSSDRPSSEVAMNLICATEFIAKSDFSSVAICMHETTSDDFCVILPATKTRKMHTSKRDAFKPINYVPIARVDYLKRQIHFLKKNYPKRAERKVVCKNKFEKKVGILKTHPGLSTEEILFYKKQKYAGLVIEGTGLGHIAINGENAKNLKALQELTKSGCIVAMTSQCLYGRVHSAVYSTARKIKNAGVIYCEDMIPETAFIKLSWLLGNFKKEEAKVMLAQNLRGEITKRTKIVYT
ncbi:MAG: Glu-tRNA(Gln) amidotransferase subunit GatD [archaeon]